MMMKDYRCRTCKTSIWWIECPTGGWWVHAEGYAQHPINPPFKPIEEMDDSGYWNTLPRWRIRRASFRRWVVEMWSPVEMTWKMKTANTSGAAVIQAYDEGARRVHR